jgi:hypothetical protein
MEAIDWFGEVKEDGTMHIRNRAAFNRYLLSFKGKQVRITIEKLKKKRSNPQNRFYWGIVVPLVKDGLINAGYELLSSENVHDFLKGQFLKGENINKDTGDILTYTKSTTELSTSEFMDFIAAIQQWAAENLSITIPDPIEMINQ